MDSLHYSHNHRKLTSRCLLLLLLIVCSPLGCFWNELLQQVAANPSAAMSMSSLAIGNKALASSPLDVKSRVPLFAGKANLNGLSSSFLSKSNVNFLGSNLKLSSKFDTMEHIQPIELKNTYETHEQDLILAEMAETFGEAPPDCYNNLLSRFDNWKQEYKKLSRDSARTGQLENNPGPLIREAFEQASIELEIEDCDDDTGSLSEQSSKESKGDFVYNLFKKAIETMDNLLNNFDQFKEYYDDLMQMKGLVLNETLSDRETREQMIEFIMNRSLHYSKKILKLEMKKLAIDKAVDNLSNILVNQFGYPGNPMDYLVPIAEALDSDTLSMVGEMMSSANFRGAIALINSQNPMPFTRCRSKRKIYSPIC